MFSTDKSWNFEPIKNTAPTTEFLTLGNNLVHGIVDKLELNWKQNMLYPIR